MIISKESTGIIFGILAYFCFSILDATQKTLILYHSVFQLLLVKYFFVLFLSLIESKRKNNINFYKSKSIKLQIFRSLLSVIESGCFVLSFKYLSLADAHSVGSLAPVIVVALSAIFLKEKVSTKIWIAIFIGFIGVLIILRPTSSIFDPKALLPLLAAFVLGLYQVVTKKVSEHDTTETSLFYTGATLIFDHGHGISTLYMHMDEIFVNVGDHVKKGDIIATVGSTGRSTGPHLDVRLNWFGTRLDPATILKIK